MSSEQARIDQLTRSDRSGQPPALTSQQQGELGTAQQQLSADRAQYSELVRSLTDIEAQNARSTDNLVVISPAGLPDKQVLPKPLLNLAVALVAGRALAFGVVIAGERLDQSVEKHREPPSRNG